MYLLICFFLVIVFSFIAYNLPVPTSINNEYFEMNDEFNHNPFNNYFDKQFYKGMKVDWKPSLPYNHLTPEYQSHYHDWDLDCLNIEKEKPWLNNNNYELADLPDIDNTNI